MRVQIMAAAVALSPLLSTGAFAQDQTEIDELREQLRQLEQRLDAAEAAQKTAEPEPEPAKLAVPNPAQTAEAKADAQPQTAAVSGAGESPRSNAFNPSVSLILNANYRHLELDPDTFEIGGFVPSGGHGDGDGHGHGGGPGERGFSLDETELVFSANIDPYWYGFFEAGLLDGEVDIEEAWIQNSGYIPGLVSKLGRFFSGIGYLNEQHPHAWDFVDTPLVYQSFMGGNLIEDGFQFRYVAPTPLFLEFGAEVGRGNNFPGSERAENGPNAYAGYIHLGGDVGFSNSYRIGTSYRDTKAYEREYDDTDSTGTEVENVFSDLDSTMWGVDFIWKWAPDGDPTAKNFRFQTEYYVRDENGQLGYDLDDVTGAFAQEGAYSSDQDGWYAQAIYQFVPRWRAGVRYDQLDSGTLNYEPIANGSLTRDDLQLLREHKPKRGTIMVDFSPSEFSRFRLQYAQDKSRFDMTDDQVVFQYIVSLGAHGAHKF